jgi:hypothetical protein
MNIGSIPYRPLGLIANAVEEVGLIVSYSYEDLIFVDSTVVLLKMYEKPYEVLLYSNTDCNEEDAKDLEIRLTIAARKQGLQLSYAGKFSLKEKADKELDITFL